MNPITKDDLEIIWNALGSYRESLIPEGIPEYDNQWSDICTVMAKIEEEIEAWENAGVFYAD